MHYIRRNVMELVLKLVLMHYIRRNIMHMHIAAVLDLGTSYVYVSFITYAYI